MTDPTAVPADDEAERRTDDEVAPEEEQLEGVLPEPTPTEGPAPAP